MNNNFSNQAFNLDLGDAVNLPRFSGHLLITQEEGNAKGYSTQKNVGIYNRL